MYNSLEKGRAEMARKSGLDHIQESIERGAAYARFDLRNRKSALLKLEKAAGGARVAVYYSRTHRAISRNDVIPFASMLQRMGSVASLDLVVVSPGGDGTAAETMLDLCRKHCTGPLRVAVPSYAKSAATLMALGADEIIMGETSELGPIDAQIEIMQDNAPQQVSADHFLRARDKAVNDLQSADPHVVQAAQIQLSMLSPAFITYCEDSMEFGRDFATKQLSAHMFKTEIAAEQALWMERIGKIVQNLTASSRHLTHGRMITVQDIQADQDLKHLKVKNLPNDDPYWSALSELLLRTEVVAQMNDVGKVLFSKDFQMYGS
jgi:membrane-bound ClpP family serine protease